MSLNPLSHAACLGVFAAVLGAAQSSLGVVVVDLIDDDFTAAEGYADGKLQFQQPDGAGNGIWLGQVNGTTQATPAVDSTGDGFVLVQGGSPANMGTGDAFLRNIWNLGATGGLLGGGSPETGAGFLLGDKIEFEVEFKFTLPDGTANHPLFISGVRDCFATCGFNAAPAAGINLGVSEFQAGNIKVFTSLGRSFTNGADNPFATFVGLPDIGIDNGFNPDTGVKDLPTDLDSDLISITYTAELTDDTTDTWTATEVVVTNVDTATEVARASVDFTGALESFKWNQDAAIPADPFDPEDMGTPAGVAASTGTDMWFGTRWIDSTNAAASASFDSVRFQYTRNSPPLDGDYNEDGVVDAADYTVWRDTEGQVGGGLAADGTGDDLLGVPDGDVDSFDRDFWVANYGSNAFAVSTAIPEPVGVVLAGVALAACGLGSRRNG